MKVCFTMSTQGFAAQFSLLYHFCYIADSEKILGWALSHHLMQNPEADADAKLVLSSER